MAGVMGLRGTNRFAGFDVPVGFFRRASNGRRASLASNGRRARPGRCCSSHSKRNPDTNF